MQVFVACVILYLCGVQLVSGYGMLNTLRMGIVRQKSEVQSTVSRLERESRQFESKLSRQLSDAKINSMQEINAIVNPAIKTIEDATKKSTAEGRDATHCYVAAKAKLRESSMNSWNELDGCRATVLSSTSETQNNFDAAVMSGQQVLSYYDSILTSCFAINMQQLESCVVGKLPEGAQITQAFQVMADTVIGNSGSVSSTAQTNAISCNRGPVANVRDDVSSAKFDANQCVAALSMGAL